MAFPDDLSDVVVFKLHPAIGVERVDNNDDHYVFGQGPANYKSGKKMKRQAVQFRLVSSRAISWSSPPKRLREFNQKGGSNPPHPA